MTKFYLTLFLSLFFARADGQKLIRDFWPGPYYSYINFMGNTLHGFVLNTYTTEYGTELYISDGSANGTRLLKDILPGSSSSLHSNIAFSNDTLTYFQAYQEGSSPNTFFLWRTDGTTEGTFAVDSFGMYFLDIQNKQATFFKGKFYYTLHSGNSKILCVTDGTEAGTKRIMTFPDSSFTTRSELKVFNNKLYFIGADSKHGAELWCSDGTTAGTRMVFDLYTGSKSSVNYNFGEGRLVVCRDKLFFMAQRDFREGFELFYISSQTGGPWLFNDFSPNFGANSNILLNEGNDSFFFINLQNSPVAAYVSDGNWNNTRNFHSQVPADPNNYFYCYDIYEVNQKTLVSTYTPGTGLEFFKSDAQLNNHGVLKDIFAGGGNGINGSIKAIKHQNRLYFMANNNMLGTDLWVSDGTYDSTVVYLEFIGNDMNGSYNLHAWNNRIFFSGLLDNAIGAELYELVLRPNSGIETPRLTHGRIYPNPVKAGETLSVSEGNCQLELYNLKGQKVWERYLTDTQIILPDDLSKGLYTAVLRFQDNIQTTKIMIE